MVSIEKVIKGFEQCWEKEPNTRNCNECPYLEYRDQGHGKSCADRMHLDALELLKGQEPVKPIRMHHSEHKQTDNYRCGKCGDDIYFEQRFCECCGQAVKWE